MLRKLFWEILETELAIKRLAHIIHAMRHRGVEFEPETRDALLIAGDLLAMLRTLRGTIQPEREEE